MITLHTYGGLANRMRVIDSTWQVCRNSGHRLQVIWEMSHDLNCSFFKLFMPIEQFGVKEFYIPRFANRMKRQMIKLVRTAGMQYPPGYQRYIFNREIEDAKETGNIGSLFAKDEKLYVYTVHQFATGDDSFRYFRPVADLDDIIGSLKSDFSDNTVGIHIRRTDNILSIRNSPREAFVDRMKQAIEEHPDTRFFLATDSDDEERYLKHEFPGRIITFEKELSRNSEKGIRDALVDLYCLAGTRKIIGSFYSSFSEVAAQIGDIPLEIVDITMNKIQQKHSGQQK